MGSCLPQASKLSVTPKSLGGSSFCASGGERDGEKERGRERQGGKEGVEGERKRKSGVLGGRVGGEGLRGRRGRDKGLADGDSTRTSMHTLRHACMHAHVTIRTLRTTHANARLCSDLLLLLLPPLPLHGHGGAARRTMPVAHPPPPWLQPFLLMPTYEQLLVGQARSGKSATLPPPHPTLGTTAPPPPPPPSLGPFLS
jgi:hypothetical protein